MCCTHLVGEAGVGEQLASGSDHTRVHQTDDGAQVQRRAQVLSADRIHLMRRGNALAELSQHRGS
jgi:hypothetical protein